MGIRNSWSSLDLVKINLLQSRSVLVVIVVYLCHVGFKTMRILIDKDLLYFQAITLLGAVIGSSVVMAIIYLGVNYEY